MQKSERTLANPVTLPGLSTAIQSTRSKCRREASALPEYGALRLPRNPGCFAEVTSAVSPHVQVNPWILSKWRTIRPEAPRATSACNLLYAKCRSWRRPVRLVDSS